MSISGTVLCNKFRETIPAVPSSITPEVFNKLCEETAVQPFLKWFCESVSRENVLSDEEIQIKNHLQKTGQWLQGEELDVALEEATRDCPELLTLVTSDALDLDKHYADLEAEKEAFKVDVDYIEALEESTKNLRDHEEKVDEDIENEETLLEKDRIEMEKAYIDCTGVLEEFDVCHKEFYKDIEQLVNIYADAADGKGPPTVWTQMPLELYSKQMEIYNNHLTVYVKRQFGSTDENDETNDLDSAVFMDDSREKRVDDMLQELSSSQRNYETSKIEEITARVHEKACAAMVDYALDIYNNGNINIPQTQAQMRTKIAELTGKRDFLDENVGLLQKQLEAVVRQTIHLEIMKILVNNTRGKLKRREDRLKELERIRKFAREHGHAYSDLLCMLMELQYRSVTEIVEFVADARHYLATEYSLSSTRYDSMVQQQAEYNAMSIALPKDQNAFNRIFVSMMLGTDNGHDVLSLSMKRHDDVTRDNKRREKNLLEVDLDARIDCVRPLENKVLALYNCEANVGPTITLNPIPYKLEERSNRTTNCVEELQRDVMCIRNKMKEMVRKGIAAGFKREKQILWQRFLADPETLKRNYEEAKSKTDRSHFGDNF